MARRNGNETLDVHAVRYELYGLLAQMEDMANHHKSAWGAEHKEPCVICRDYEQERRGIKRAIRLFGGNPSKWW